VTRWLLKPWRIVYALAYFLAELVIANFRLAWDVVTPGLPPTAGIIRVDTDARTAGEIWLVANAISMTPGTLTLEVDADARHLYVHTLYAEDRSAFERQIGALERALLAAMR
jgi:multicomponent Na+:H+ antiporter subunit E